MAVDAAVLRAYDLPPQLEARLLDQMSGPHARRPVAEGFKGYPRRARATALPLWLYLSLRHFHDLVDRELAGALTEGEAAELRNLEARLAEAEAGAEEGRPDWLRGIAEERDVEGGALKALRAEAAGRWGWWGMIIQRAAGTPAFNRYQHYKPYLRGDFRHSCAYCLLHERHLLTDQWSFTIDHFRPKKLPQFRHLRNVYTNLYYACPPLQHVQGQPVAGAVDAGAGERVREPVRAGPDGPFPLRRGRGDRAADPRRHLHDPPPALEQAPAGPEAVGVDRAGRPRAGPVRRN